jgi:hypothetical protein
MHLALTFLEQRSGDARRSSGALQAPWFPEGHCLQKQAPFLPFFNWWELFNAGPAILLLQPERKRKKKLLIAKFRQPSCGRFH